LLLTLEVGAQFFYILKPEYLPWWRCYLYQLFVTSQQAVVNMYLIEEVSTEVKHAITLYLLQDLAALAKSEAGEAVIASFIQRFMLSPSLVHQIQGLWFIDHEDFEVS
jgi:hypothetical protein